MFRALALLAVVGLAGQFLSAADPADARAVIDKSIQALGGQAKLEKFKAQTWSEKGTYYGMGDDGLPYVGHYAVQWPNQFRMEIVGVFTSVLDKDKGWRVLGAATEELTKEQFAEQLENLHAGYVSSLVPLKDPAYQLTSLPATEIDGKPAVGVKVSHKSHRDVSLWFDKATNLLVKNTYKVKPEDLGGAEALMENTFSDYKEVEGIKVPMKIVMKRDGKRFVEAENQNVKPVGQLPDKTFAKP